MISVIQSGLSQCKHIHDTIDPVFLDATNEGQADPAAPSQLPDRLVISDSVLLIVTRLWPQRGRGGKLTSCTPDKALSCWVSTGLSWAALYRPYVYR